MPATVNVPTRGPEVFAAAEKVTVAVPLPDSADVMVNQDAWLESTQEQPLPALRTKAPVAAAGPMV